MPNRIQCLRMSVWGGEAMHAYECMGRQGDAAAMSVWGGSARRLAADATAPTPDNQHSNDERATAEAMTPAEATKPRTSHLPHPRLCPLISF